MTNYKMKFVKSAAALALGASVITSAVVAGDLSASAKTTYKLSNGKLVNAKTKKAIKGYKVYKSVLYKDGKKYTGTYKAKYYKSGKLFTGKTSKGVYYKAGKKFTGTTSYGYYYKNGVRYTGKTTSGIYYKNGKKFNGTTTAGYYYINGKRAEGIVVVKGVDVLYKNGKVVADKTAPVITIDGQKDGDKIELKNGADFATPKASVKDNVDSKVKVVTEIKDQDGKVVDAIDTKVAGTYTITYAAKDASGNASAATITVEVADADFSLVSVKTLNSNYVTVSFKTAKKDLLGQTVEVKNADGKVIEVKPVDVALGDSVADFEFVTPVKAEDLKGVWTINGQSYDLDLYNNLTAFLAATDQITLNNVLTKLGVANVKVENIQSYLTAKADLNKTAEELTVADVQKLVNTVNTKKLDAAAEAEIVKSVQDAIKDGNDVALLSALQNPAFERVNSNWVTTASTGYAETIEATDDTIAKIQAKINAANDAIIKDTYTVSGVDKEKLAASKSLVAQYATVDEKGVVTDADLKAAPAKIDEQMAVADVIAATTPTSLKSKLVALADVVNTKDATVLDLTKYVDANGKAYVAKLKDADVTAKDETSELVGLINTVNSESSNSLVEAVKTAATGTVDADKLLAAIKALGLKQVADSNKAVYAKEASFATVSDSASVQAAVEAANVTAVTDATDADQLLTALQVLELKNVVAANKAAYLADVKSGSATIKDNATTIDAALKAINENVAKEAAVKSINDATTADQVKTALDTLAFSDYLNVTSSDRIFIAEKVLAAKDALEGKKFANATAAETAVTTATTDRTTAIAGVNALTKSSTLTEVAKALLAVGHSSLTGTVENPTANDTEIADTFYKTLSFDDAAGSLKSTFRSISDIRAAIK